MLVSEVGTMIIGYIQLTSDALCLIEEFVI